MIVIFFGSIAIAAFMRSWIALTLFTGLIFLSIPLFSLIWAMIAAKSIEIRRELPDEGVAGEQLFATYQLTSRSFFSAFGVRFTDNATRGYISGLDLTASSTLTLIVNLNSPSGSPASTSPGPRRYLPLTGKISGMLRLNQLPLISGGKVIGNSATSPVL